MQFILPVLFLQKQLKNLKNRSSNLYFWVMHDVNFSTDSWLDCPVHMLEYLCGGTGQRQTTEQNNICKLKSLQSGKKHCEIVFSDNKLDQRDQVKWKDKKHLPRLLELYFTHENMFFIIYKKYKSKALNIKHILKSNT